MNEWKKGITCSLLGYFALSLRDMHGITFGMKR